MSRRSVRGTRTISHELVSLSSAISAPEFRAVIPTVQALQLESIVGQRIWAVSGLLYRLTARTYGLQSVVCSVSRDARGGYFLNMVVIN